MSLSCNKSRGVKSRVYPNWNQSIRFSTSDIDSVHKDYRFLVSRVFEMHATIDSRNAEGMSLPEQSWWTSTIGILEYISIYCLLTLGPASCTPRLFRARQKLLRALSILCRSLGRLQLCAYLCHIMQQYASGISLDSCEQSKEKVTPVQQNFGLLSTPEEGAYHITDLIHSITILEVISQFSASPESTGAPQVSSLQKLVRYIRRAFYQCEKSLASCGVSSSRPQVVSLKSMIRAEDETFPRQEVVRLGAESAPELSCCAHFLPPGIFNLPKSGPNLSEMVGRLRPVLDVSKFRIGGGFMPSRYGECGCRVTNTSLGTVTALPSEIEMFRSRIYPSIPGFNRFQKPRAMVSDVYAFQDEVLHSAGAVPALRSGRVDPARSISRPHLNEAVHAAAKAVVQRAEQKIHIAYAAVSVLHNFFRCIYGILSQRHYYEADPQAWKNSDKHTAGRYNSVGAAVALLARVERSKNATFSQTEDAVAEICDVLLKRKPGYILEFKKDLTYPRIDCSDSLSSDSSTESEGESTQDTNNHAILSTTDSEIAIDGHCMSPLFIAGLFGSWKVVHVFLSQSAATVSVLKLSPCHKHLIWHTLMETPSLPSNDRDGVTVIAQRRSFEKTLVALISAGFCTESPDGAIMSSLYLAAVKQLPLVLSALISAGFKAKPCLQQQRHLLSPFHVMTLGYEVPAALLRSAVDIDATALEVLQRTGELQVPECGSDVSLHVDVVHSYADVCCSYGNDSASTKNLSYSFSESLEKRSSRMTRNFAECYESLLAPSYRKIKCPVYRLLRKTSESICSNSCATEDILANRLPVRLHYAGPHLAIASRNADKFLITMQVTPCSMRKFETDEDPMSSNYNSADIINWLCVSCKDNTEEKDSTSAFLRLLHLSSFYEMPSLIPVLSKVALTANREYISTSVGQGAYTIPELKFLVPSCNLSLFFEPLNRVCTPLEVAIRTGHASCVQACIDAASEAFSTLGGGDNVSGPITCGMIADCVSSGIGGDKMCSLLFRSLTSASSAAELWIYLCGTASSHPTIASNGESILHIAIRRGYSLFLEAACDVYKVAEAEGCKVPALSAITDIRGVNLLQASIASGHGCVTQVLGPLFITENKAVREITLQLRKMLVKRYLNKRKKEILSRIG